MSPGLRTLITNMQDMAALDYAYGRVMRERIEAHTHIAGLPEYYKARAIHHQQVAAKVSAMDRQARGVEE